MGFDCFEDCFGVGGFGYFVIVGALGDGFVEASQEAQMKTVRIGKGWHKESERHSKAARGLTQGIKTRYSVRVTPNSGGVRDERFDTKEDAEKYMKFLGHKAVSLKEISGRYVTHPTDKSTKIWKEVEIKYPHASFLKNVEDAPSNWFQHKKTLEKNEPEHFYNAKDHYNALSISDGLTGIYHVFYNGKTLFVTENRSDAVKFAKKYMEEN